MQFISILLLKMRKCLNREKRSLDSIFKELFILILRFQIKSIFAYFWDWRLDFRNDCFSECRHFFRISSGPLYWHHSPSFWWRSTLQHRQPSAPGIHAHKVGCKCSNRRLSSCEFTEVKCKWSVGVLREL